jgi:hypothetical protein
LLGSCLLMRRGHFVESAGNGVHGSPAYEMWGRSRWAEFYIYDLYSALGMDREAKCVYRRFTGNTDDFPRRGPAGSATGSARYGGTAGGQTS